MVFKLRNRNENFDLYQNKLLSKSQFTPDQLSIFKKIKAYLVENFTLII